MGESMGGFNAAILALKNESLFKRVALLCPGIPTLGPYTPEAEVKAFLDRNKAFVNEGYVRSLIAWARDEFPTQKDWTNHDPLNLVNGLSKASPTFYVSCGAQDEYGFFEGAEQFTNIARAKGVWTQWVPLKGAHCAIDANTVASFFGNSAGYFRPGPIEFE
jgi:S-formylglutathione hydrolase FrmB